MKSHGCLCKKISGRRGAAVLIALLVFLLGALSGTIALTMATSNAGRYTHEKDDQQAYLAVASAAKLVLNKLDNVSIEYKSKGKTTPETESDLDITYFGADYTVAVPGTSIPYETAGMFFSDQRFQTMLKTFSLKNGGTADPVSFILTVPNATEMGRVYVSIQLQGAEFSFRFYSMRGESRDYQITMRVTAAFDKDGAGNFMVRTDGYYYRVMTFRVASAMFSVENLSGGERE